ncbi:hypothetical protein MMYC01_201541 [Madurella mycetomatis]|uniref:Uncharacterized protein n=1 Tax=Madurella mycetomatis TaxID=100816 RepID=A0A175WF37_9PEZI|nr:hypothetical protein MMYC01_201541 [Madurella mycetomatis]
MLRRLNLAPFPIARIAILLSAFLPIVSAAVVEEAGEDERPEGAAEAVDAAGFWLGFTLLVVISAVESAASLLWIRVRITSDGVHPYELSVRTCGREVVLQTIEPEVVAEISERGMPAGFSWGLISSATYSQWGVVQSHMGSSRGCSTCGGIERRYTWIHHGATEVLVDKFGCVTTVPTLLIRRFNPMTALKAPAGLVGNGKDLVRGKNSPGRVMGNVMHLIVGLTDVSLGVAGLALNPGSPQRLYETLKDPEAAITLENYSTLFLLYWLLGAVLLLFMIPLHSERKSIQIFGWPWVIAFLVAGMANFVLFCLGCWKIDVARRTGADWTPMLSYWLSGASAIQFPLFGIEVFHTFGAAGLIVMLIQEF